MSSDLIRKYIVLLEKNSYKSSSGLIVNVVKDRKPLVLFYGEGFSMEKKMEIEISNQPSLGTIQRKGKESKFGHQLLSRMSVLSCQSVTKIIKG